MVSRSLLSSTAIRNSFESETTRCVAWSGRNRLEIKHGLGVLDTSKLTLLDSLERKGSNQSSTDTATILGSHDLNGIVVALVLLLGPVEHFAQGLGAAGLEVGVLVKHRAVGTDMGGLVALLLADSSDTTGTKTGGAGSDKFGQAADEFELGLVALERELAAHQLGGLGQVLEGVPGDMSVTWLLLTGIAKTLTPRLRQGRKHQCYRAS